MQPENQLTIYEMATGIVLPTKENATTIAKTIAHNVMEEGQDVLETLVKLEAIKSVCEQARELLNDHCRAELEKYGKEGVTKLDAKMELAEVGVKYDYSADAVWYSLKDDENKIAFLRKERERLLKTVTKTITEVDPETGETTEIVPPSKTSKSSFKISLGK